MSRNFSWKDSSGKMLVSIRVWMNTSYETESYNNKEIVNFGIFSVGQNKLIKYPYILKCSSLCKLLNFLFPVAFSYVWNRFVCFLSWGEGVNKHVQVPQWPPGGDGASQTLLPSGRRLENLPWAVDAGLRFSPCLRSCTCFCRSVFWWIAIGTERRLLFKAALPR